MMPTSDSPFLTFLFTDIEGSTRRWEHEPDAMAIALQRHDALVRSAITAAGGTVFKHTGDGLCAVFGDTPSGLSAAIEAQRALDAEEWPLAEPLRARMGVHCGAALQVDDDYFGPTLNRAARIMAAGHGGQTLSSAAVVAALGGRTPPGIELLDFGEHNLRDLSGTERIFQVCGPDAPRAFPALRVLDSYRHNLPNQATNIVGREHDIRMVVDLVRTNRLVTLSGIGGCGKTRLAQLAAAELLPEHPGGTWLVDLTVAGPSFVARAIAKAVGHGERLAGLGEGDQQGVLAQLTKAIGASDVLIVLDNCEHVVQSAAECVAALLQRCENIRVLTTSREALRIAGERVYAVSPLALPPEDAVASSVLASASGELFAGRAAAVQPDFAVTDRNAAAVASICRRLDGLPLAIELAAARVRMLSPLQIDERLADALRLLTGGDRAADQRHQTLTATLEWSHDLLSEREQAVLRRLSVFAGGFMLEAAEQVCGFGDVSDDDVMDCVEALVDRSLVNASMSEPVRFNLLEVVRQFAAHRLDAAGETPIADRRHFDWALALAESAAPIEHVDGTRVLADEAPNLRVAMRACTRGRASSDERLLLAYTLWRYMLESGRIPEGLAWLDLALADGYTTGTLLEARALDAAGFLASLRGDFDRARAHINRSVRLCRELDDPLALAWTLLRSGLINGVQGALDDASSPFHESLDIMKREEYPVGQSWAHLELGRAYVTMDHLDLASAQFELAAVHAETSDPSTLRYGRVGVEACKLMRGGGSSTDLAHAVAELVRMDMLYTSTQGLLLACAASISADLYADAARYSSLALEFTHRSGGVTQAVHAVEWAAQSLAGLQRWSAAAALWGYVLATRSRLGSIEPPLIHRLQAPLVEALHTNMGDDRLRAVELASSQLPLDDIVRLARSELASDGHGSFAAT